MITVLLIVALFAAAVIGWCGAVEAHQRAVRLEENFRTACEVAERRKEERDQARDNWAHYESLYHGSVAVNAAMLEHISEEREAAAWKALTDSPNYFAQVAASEAKRLDEEWLDLDFSEDQG